MDKLDYLRLCQKNAVYPKSVVVAYNGDSYYPLERVEWFTKKGEMELSAVLQSVKSNSIIRCRVKEVENVENESQQN